MGDEYQVSCLNAEDFLPQRSPRPQRGRGKTILHRPLRAKLGKLGEEKNFPQAGQIKLIPNYVFLLGENFFLS
jgi:hypothetical protein